MTEAASQPTTATVKRPKQPTCKNPSCRKQFRPKTKRALYCSDACRYKKAGTKKLVDPVEKALKTAFFYFLARECVRARTLDILRGHTVESLSALYKLYTVNMFANGFGGVEAFELSHIFPVNGDERLGLLRADNLVCAPTALNKAHGKRHFGFGQSVPRPLDPKYTVGKKARRSDVIPRIVDYLGTELVAATVKACKMKPAHRSRLIDWITSHYNPSDPVHKAALPDLNKLDNLKPRELEHIKAAMLGQDIGEFVPDPPTRPEIVLCRELTRLSEYRPELGPYAYALTDVLTRYKRDGATYLRGDFFTDHHAQIIFDVLHGKPLAVMRDSLEMVIAENTECFMYFVPGRSVSFVTNPETQDSVLNTLSSQYYQPGSSRRQVVITSLAAFKASVSAQIAPHVDPEILVPAILAPSVMTHSVYDPPYFA